MSGRNRNTLRGCKVLLVEDERVVREIIYRLLISAGVASIVECPSAETAWEAMVGPKAQPFHAIITDITLPGASGITLLKTLRQLPGARAKTIPAIVLSGDSTTETFKKFEHLNISSYLIKPVSAGLLKSAREKALGISQPPVAEDENPAAHTPTSHPAKTDHTVLAI